MKNSILIFLLGVFVTISIAATSTSLMTVKPATPKATIVSKEIGGDYLYIYIIPYLKQGYVIKHIFRSGGNVDSRCVVILEKY